MIDVYDDCANALAPSLTCAQTANPSASLVYGAGKINNTKKTAPNVTVTLQLWRVSVDDGHLRI